MGYRKNIKSAGDKDAQREESLFPAASEIQPESELSRQDRLAWAQVARTVRPLCKTGLPHKTESHKKGRAAQNIMHGVETTYKAAASAHEIHGLASVLRKILPEPRQNRQDNKAQSRIYKEQVQNSAETACLNRFDYSAYRRLEQGRLPIEAKIDLHDHTQEEAHDALLYFVQKASMRGLRHLLIITGKGSSYQSEGVLQRQVPHWLVVVPFRFYIAAVERAGRPHGGGGAFYVRLRRPVR